MAIYSIDELNTILSEAEGRGVVFPRELKNALSCATSPHYKIGVVGRFQVGKTTLTNRVFLKDQLLKEGEGLCTTAVCTEVAYGPTQTMIVVKDGETREVEQPSTADIVATTTAETEEARLALAQSITRLRIETPNESLRPYTILDTPGIDDPNRALLDITTYRELPQCDLVLLVAEAKQLSEVDFAFLNGSIFKAGLTKVMVLLSYNKDDRRLAAPGRAMVLDTVRASLTNRGLKDIPVRMVCYDGAAPDILDTPEKVEAEVLGYLSREVAQGRVIRLYAQVAAAIAARAQEQRLLGELAKKNRAEIEQLNRQRELEEIELEGQLETIRGRMTRDLRAAAKEVRGLVSQRCAEFKSATAQGDAANLEESELRSQIDALCSDVLAQAQQACSEVAQQHMADVAALLDGMDDFLGEAASEADASIQRPTGSTTKKTNLFTANVSDLIAGGGQMLEEVGAWEAIISRLPGRWGAIAATVVNALPTVLGFLRNWMGKAEVENRFVEVEQQLGEAVDDLFARFKSEALTVIDDRIQAERAQLQSVFQQALDDQEDDPVAIAAEVEALEALIARLTK